MKRIWVIFALFFCPLQAQTVGNAALEGTKNWQNWTFAATMLVTAAGGILIVSMHDGKSVESTAH